MIRKIHKIRENQKIHVKSRIKKNPEIHENTKKILEFFFVNLIFSMKIVRFPQCVCAVSLILLQVSAVPNSRAALFFGRCSADLLWGARSWAAAGTGSKIICWTAPQLFFRAKRVNVYSVKSVQKVSAKCSVNNGHDTKFVQHVFSANK